MLPVELGYPLLVLVTLTGSLVEGGGGWGVGARLLPGCLEGGVGRGGEGRGALPLLGCLEGGGGGEGWGALPPPRCQEDDGAWAGAWGGAVLKDEGGGREGGSALNLGLLEGARGDGEGGVWNEEAWLDPSQPPPLVP